VPLLGSSAAAPPFGEWGWHHHWAALPPVLDFVAVPLVLGAVVAVLSAGRWCVEWLGARREKRRTEHPITRGSGEAVLVSEAERERAGDVIARAIGDARLGLDEGLDRIERLWQVRTRHELTSLVDDLPELPVTRRSQARFVGAVAIGTVAAVLQGIAGIWELWPVALVAALVAAAQSRR